MENPRPEKVAVVDEVRTRISEADATILTEYRGLTVAEISQLRRNLRDAGGDYKVYKNTLVRFAVNDLGLGELSSLLTGPTAIAFIKGDAVAVAKALKDFGKGNPNLVVKGGLLGDKILSEADTSALADIAPREELLARLAGGIAAPLQSLAGLLKALPNNFAYALKALIDQGGAPGAPAAETATEEAPAEAESAESTDSAAAPEAAAETGAETETLEVPGDAETAEAAPTNVPADADRREPEATPDSETTEASTESDATGDTATEEN